MFETKKYKLELRKGNWKNHKQHTLFYFAVVDLSKGAMSSFKLGVQFKRLLCFTEYKIL